jgi:hypothetical protein
LWLGYYRRAAPSAQLIVVDHASDDGSTDNLAGVCRIPLPRDAHDENDRTTMLNSLHQAFLRYYDLVIYVDCDELIVPDPTKSASLEAHLNASDYAYASPVGINVLHIASLEPPLDFSRPLLRQRRFGQFASVMCKPVVTRVPLQWQPGFHCCDKPYNIDPDLYLFHIKAIDRECALQRQRLLRGISWSQRAIEMGASAHHRATDDQFLDLFFDRSARDYQQFGAQPFAFDAEIARLMQNVEQIADVHAAPQFAGPIVEIPDRFRTAF